MEFTLAEMQLTHKDLQQACLISFVEEVSAIKEPIVA